NNDGITNNGVITINNLEVGVTWQYSVNGGNDFIDGTGSSFTLANNTTYVANAIQIKQTDAVGNVSDIGKNTLRIVVDNANPIFNLQPTAINVDVDTPITTTVYDAQATNLNGGNADEGITYRIKGTNADKFSITTDTGILTYKTIQTSAHDNDTVTIVATDVAGNETEQLITVSVKIFTRGFVINGKNVNDESGHSVSTAGDVNGDGLDDLIIGALNADPSNKKLSAGKSYVVFGKIDNTTIELSTIANGTGGFIINGEIQYDRSGASVSNAGDVNGDGLDDLIVGARNAGLNDKKEIGKSYIIFGKIDSTAINLSAIASGTGGFVINGENAMDYSGWSVSTAGDVNGDNLDDLIVSAYGADPSGKESAGKSYVIFGKTDNTVINLSDIGTGGFVINGENAGDKSGWSASNAGDVNGDGLDDLIIGASKADPNGRIDAGKSYIVFGKTDNTAINLSAIANGTGGFVINSERVWINWNTILVSNAGDVNGDGLDDLIIGAKSASPNNKAHAGKSYVIFGKTNNTAIDLSAIGTAGFVINGEKSGDWSGVSISTAGDVNGDGLDDLIVGADQVDLNGKLNIGKSYVVFGKTDNTEINLSAIVSGTGGFVINGENAYDYSGYSVSTAGDVNGDGLDDLIVGAYNADPNNQRGAGKSYVIFGKTDTDTINLVTLGRNSKYAIDYLGDENANTFTGTNNDEIFVAGTGDDTLIGNGGMDVFNAGAGNDTIVINASNVAALAQTGTGNRARVDGGGNIDTLTLDGSGLTLDLTNISNIRIQDIEKIDITGSGNNTLILNLNDVFDASTSANILKVLGNSGDSVNASGFAKISGAKTESSI
ncbi:RTX toxins and related Ca2+-binding proteins, partial [Bathymodiolus brooksi thiotrophic gill symbiont]